MNAPKFSNALGKIDDKYVIEAVTYDCKNQGGITSKTLKRHFSVALIAAILAMLLMGAGVAAIIYGDSIQSWLGHYWEIITGQQISDEQAAIINHLSQDIGLSQTVDEVTVTVDSATVGYDNFFLLLCVNGFEPSNRHGYGFEHVTMDVTPDPVCESGGIGGFGFRYLGLDGDGSVLLLLDYSYTSGMDNIRDTRPIDIVLTLENILQSPFTDKEKLIAAGNWSFEFSLDRSKEIEAITLPDTEVMAMDSEKQELVPVMIRNIVLTSTGLSFQFDYNKGTLAIGGQITVLLDNGESIRDGGGSGTPLEDGNTLNCSHQWPVPINLNEAVAVQIGETEIVISPN